MRGDVDGYTNEYHPASSQYKAWFPGYKGNTKMFRLIGNGRIVLDTKKRLPMYQELNKVLMDEMLQVPLDLVLEVPGREQQAEEHVRRVHGLQPGSADAYLIKSRLATERRGRRDAGPRPHPTLHATLHRPASRDSRLHAVRDLGRDLHAGAAAARAT